MSNVLSVTHSTASFIGLHVTDVQETASNF